MGEWEGIFGAGVSAESVIDQINESWFEEQEENNVKKYKRSERERKGQLTAYLGSEEVKETFIRWLRDNARRHQESPCDGELLKIIYPHDREFHDIEDRYRIPVPLAYILEEVGEGIRRGDSLHHQPGMMDKIALEWLIKCFDAIQPGVDLRLVVHKFAAIMTQEAVRLRAEKRIGYSNRKTEVVSACAPAIDIVYARARGVFVQDDIVAAATQSARNAISKDWTFGVSGGDSIDDFRAAVVESAVGLDQESASLAARYVVMAKYECCLYGDAFHGMYWRDISQDIMRLLEQAPVNRIKLINLNETSRLLADFDYIGYEK
ncbi:hypothetical protein [Azospirillum brasilense]|uniref:hypothetical protein n=1 Tax=Azospirillum brasilense TaxID=192 RepID=UPI0011786CA1|nr:hypothetical protein [Azospirillum brasilense]